jgi:hypothetical protein
MTLKQFIYKTPFIKLAKNIEAGLQYVHYLNQSDQLKGVKTVYCISPYKTGTTFLSSSFDESVARHEPDHYLTLKKLDTNFDKFFIKRMNKLNLKLECSGFWSGYIDQLANHKIASELDYICILREPSSWISSCINFWTRPYTLGMNFELENELFWKPKVGIDIRDYGLNDKTNQEIIDKLINFYFDFTNRTQKLKNIHYIKLKELENNISIVGDLIGEKPNIAKRWMRKAKDKRFVYKNEELDRKYNQLISTYKPFISD